MKPILIHIFRNSKIKYSVKENTYRTFDMRFVNFWRFGDGEPYSLNFKKRIGWSRS